MANELNLDSKTFRRTPVSRPAPSETVFPDRDHYVGSPQMSDAATIAGPVATPKQAVPGVGMRPGEPWKSLNPADRKRGAFRR